MKRGGQHLRILFKVLLFVAAFLAISFYLNFSFGEEDILVKDPSSVPHEDQSLTKDIIASKDHKLKAPKEGLSTLIGKDVQYLESRFGRPSRIDPSDYGYDWWIYNNNKSKYFQAGVKNKKIVTVYAIGEQVAIDPFRIGQPVEELYKKVPIETYITLNYEGSTYRFELTETDINTSPLVQMGDLYVQLYIDKFLDTLSSVRILDKETLIKLRPYELVYRGELLEVEPPESVREEEINRANEKQIFDITNIMRDRYNLKPLEWDEDTAKVALAHSMDMYESKDFSHKSAKYGELSERLEAGEVPYKLAGENIAANYIDAPAVMEGWLNSKAHRETLLNDEFTHIGVGVFKKHYTQNLIQK